MGGVSTEQIETAKQVDILDYLMRREPDNLKKVGNRYVLRDHDSFVISNGKWCWNSRNFGCKTATALNYLIEVRNFNFTDAVRELSDGEVHSYPVPQKANAPPEPKEFALPPRNRDNKRIIAYLQSRGIDRQVIVDCISRASLYESAKFHNCVFVGRDNKGKSRFASMRGTLSDFRLDVDGSDKRFGFIIPPSDPNSTAVAVYEAPVDALSHQTLCNQKFIESFDGWRLSLGGTSLLALIHFLENHPKINTCVICTDNDEAGNLAADKIAELPGITSVRSPPMQGKDWNETLISKRNEVNIMEDVRQDIRFINSGYKTLFTIKDGDSIKFTSGYDGKVSEMKCRFIDETHMTANNETYHICQWAEICERNGNKYEPAPKQERKIDILSANYGENLKATALPMTESALKRLVGGKYEVTPLRYPSGKVCATLVSGKEGIAVCGIKDETFTSLHPYNAQTYKRELSPAQPLVQDEKKPSLLSKLDSAKEKAAGQKAVNAHSDSLKKRDTTELG